MPAGAGGLAVWGQEEEPLCVNMEGASWLLEQSTPNLAKPARWYAKASVGSEEVLREWWESPGEGPCSDRSQHRERSSMFSISVAGESGLPADCVCEVSVGADLHVGRRHVVSHVLMLAPWAHCGISHGVSRAHVQRGCMCLRAAVHAEVGCGLSLNG